MSSKFEAFVSHDSADETLALLLKKLIEGIFLNADVFVSGKDLRGGNLWAAELKHRLSSAKVIIALITRYSKDNLWVHFESGAGFIDDRTIPICADEISVEMLDPPFKLLHARNFDDRGLKELLQDIARIVQLRQPDTHGGLAETLSEAGRFIKLRDSESSHTMLSPSQDASVASTQKKLADLHASVLEEKDAELKQRYEALKQEYHAILKQQIQNLQGRHDIPTESELDKMSYYDLDQVLSAIKAPTSRMISLSFNVLELNLPRKSASKWQKLNATHALDDLEKELRKLEKL